MIRDLVCGWLRANGIDPADVPMRERPKVSDGQISVVLWVRTEKGLQVDPGTREPLARHITVPLKVPPPPDVAQWLALRCPTSGRPG